MTLVAAAEAAVAAWALDETSGTRSDQVGSNDLTDNNTVGSTTGKFGNSAVFVKANSESLSISDNTDLSMGDVAVTFRCWVKITDKASGTNHFIFRKWNAAANKREYQIYFDEAADRIRFHASGDGTAVTAVTANNFGSIPADTWILLHCWHDPTANQIGISINAGTANTNTHTTGIFDSDNDFALGEQLEGELDDVVVLKGYVLDSTERSSDYKSGTGIAFANWNVKIVADWGPYLYSGTAANLEHHRVLTAGSSSYAINGTAASLVVGLAMAADAGSYTVSGTAASFLVNRVVAAISGSYLVAGTTSNLEYHRKMAAGSESYSVNGLDAVLSRLRSIIAGSGSYAVSGSTADLTYGQAPEIISNPRRRRAVAADGSGRRRSINATDSLRSRAVPNTDSRRRRPGTDLLN